MPVAKIESGVIVQIWRDVETVADLAAKYGLTGGDYVNAPEDAAPGWTHSGSTFSAPAPAPAPFTDLKRWQFRAQLEIAGLTGAVGAAIDALSDPATQAIARSKFNHADTFSRDDPTLAALYPQLGLTSEQVDAMWRAAEAL